MRSAALTESVHLQAVGHLGRDDGQEDLCFGLWYPSHGRERSSALLRELILPLPGERHVHGNASFEPWYYERALAAALEAGAGLAFMHSHPFSGWQGLSTDDARAERGMAGGTLAATGLPLLGLTHGAADGSWSARAWVRADEREYKPDWCATVRVVGGPLRVTFHPQLARRQRVQSTQVRTEAAWGPETQARIAGLHVGVVGLGSVGMLVAESLARMGVSRISVFDFDHVEPLNLDRILHATEEDARLRRQKVEVAARALRVSATAKPFLIEPHLLSVCEEAGFRAALDCDVLFSCVDRPWPRNVLNFIAYAHLIPVIDGGIRAFRLPGGRMRGAEWKAHVAAPGRPCLECLEQFDAGLVQAEREGHLDDPKYVEGLPDDHPVKARQNVFAFSMAAASLEVLQMVVMLAEPGGMSDVGPQCYHLSSGRIDVVESGCAAHCWYAPRVALGEHAGHPGTAVHRVAELARAGSTARSRSSGEGPARASRRRVSSRR